MDSVTKAKVRLFVELLTKDARSNAEVMQLVELGLDRKVQIALNEWKRFVSQ